MLLSLCWESIARGGTIAVGTEHAVIIERDVSSRWAGCGLTATTSRSPRNRCWAPRQPRCRQRPWLWRSASSVLPPSSRAGALCSDGGSLALQWSATLPAGRSRSLHDAGAGYVKRMAYVPIGQCKRLALRWTKAHLASLNVWATLTPVSMTACRAPPKYYACCPTSQTASACPVCPRSNGRGQAL